MMSTEKKQLAFQIYQRLKGLPGKKPKNIKNALDTKGFKLTVRQITYCCGKAARQGLMKRTKLGFRLDKRLCDAHIKGFFRKQMNEWHTGKRISEIRRKRKLMRSLSGEKEPRRSVRLRNKLSSRMRIGGITLMKDVRSTAHVSVEGVNETYSNLRGIGWQPREVSFTGTISTNDAAKDASAADWYKGMLEYFRRPNFHQ